jgi:hypothetical protein
VIAEPGERFGDAPIIGWASTPRPDPVAEILNAADEPTAVKIALDVVRAYRETTMAALGRLHAAERALDDERQTRFRLLDELRAARLALEADGLR